MAMLISFTPWFLFWIFALQARLELAALSGFVAVAAIMLKNRRQGRLPKSLQLGTLAFFILFAISVPIFGKKIIAANVDLLGNGAVLMIVFLSIIFKRPFTLDFIRERVEKKLWHAARFIQVNYLVSWLWLAVLFLNFLLVWARHFSLIQIDRWLSVVIRIFNCIVAMKLSLWYLRRRKILGN